MLIDMMLLLKTTVVVVVVVVVLMEMVINFYGCKALPSSVVSLVTAVEHNSFESLLASVHQMAFPELALWVKEVCFSDESRVALVAYTRESLALHCLVRRWQVVDVHRGYSYFVVVTI